MKGRAIVLALGAAGAGTLALALEGTVVDSFGKPIEGARVCYVVGNAELLCSGTDERGRFDLLESRQDTLRVVAEDYLPRTMAAAGITGPIELELAPTLHVRLVEAASGKAVAEGQVSVVYQTGQSSGPFPVNAAGVRIRRVLRPGEARLVATAPGYRQERPKPVRLAPGDKLEVVLELVPD